VIFIILVIIELRRRRAGVRVIAGSARGRKLIAPDNMAVRPTADRMKEDLFNILAPRVSGARFLDLFSGTGAIGIEALSRGARSAVFVDIDIALIIKNLALTGFAEKAAVLKNEYAPALRKLNEQRLAFDIIFMDPPYYKGMVPPAARLISDMGLLSGEGALAAELAADEGPPAIENLSLYKVKRYSASAFFFFKRGF